MAVKTLPLDPFSDVEFRFSDGNTLVLNISLAIIMFSVALAITKDDLYQVTSQPKKVATGVISQFLLLPLVSLLLIFLLKPYPTVGLGMMLISVCPGGNISNFYSFRAGGNVGLSIGLTLISTVLAPFMTPTNFHFWGHLVPGASPLLKTISLDVLDLFKTVFIILIIPLILGVLIQRWKPVFATRLSKPLGKISLLILVTFVVVAIAQNVDAFLKHGLILLAFSVTHHTLAIVTGFSAGWLSLRNLRDAKTLALETGVQNTGLGLALALLFFRDLDGMIVVAAFWGSWNIAGGLFWSEIFRRWKGKTETPTP